MTAPGPHAEWICCHLGAREHYAVPRSLHRQRRLRLLVADAWVRPGSAWSHVPGEAARRLSERFHPDLADADVQGFTFALMMREVFWRSHPDGWARLMRRNRWFGRRAAGVLRRLPERDRTVVFAHSYAAREVFACAKSRGWTTVLGQIDPGEHHFSLVSKLAEGLPEYGRAPEPPPPAYFEEWRDECRLADRIVVNSEWSRDLLARAGIAADKLHVIPLVYDAGRRGRADERVYPGAFTASRPLRVLFVGQVTVAKGAAALLDAMPLLTDVPVELAMVGAVTMAVPVRFRQHPAIRWIGPLSRGEVMRHYRDSDVLVFPSLSDGFGMAQIEAQGWSLPIIASRSCGRVVRDGTNGLLLDTVSPATIAAAIRRVAADPQMLAAFSRNAGGPQDGGLADLGRALVALEPS